MKTNQKNARTVTTKSSNRELYIFFREDMFYPIELKDDKDAIKSALYNRGTLKVENINGKIIWEKL